ncbi:MAG: autotransporter domain-containing protein, partial [Elusimicrobiota bacterium]|nr:autotransporter domain-containing protein [Elusimicrobiota bacterium]
MKSKANIKVFLLAFFVFFLFGNVRSIYGAFSYDNDKFNVFVFGKYILLGGDIETDFPRTPNQENAFAALKDAVSDPFLDINDLRTIREKQKGLDNLSGSFLANVLSMAPRGDYTALFERLSVIKNIEISSAPSKIEVKTSSAPKEKIKSDDYKFWNVFSLNNLSFNADGQTLDDFKASAIGAQTGADLFFSGNFIRGVFAGYNKKSLSQEQNEANMSDFEFGFYGIEFFKTMNFKWLLSAGLQQYQTNRKIALQTIYEPKADFDSYGLRAAAEVEFKMDDIIKKENIGFRPFIDLNGGLSNSQKIQETNGGQSNLSVNAAQIIRLETQLGVKIINKSSQLFDWHTKAYIGYLIMGDRQKFDMQFSEYLQSPKMSVENDEQTKFFGGIGAGIKYDMEKDMSLTMDFKGQIGQNSLNYGINLGMNYKFAINSRAQSKPKTGSKSELRQKPTFILQSMSFETNSFALSQNGKRSIADIAKEIKKKKYNNISIEGHTDLSGNQSKNITLSRQRAQAVYNELAKNGIIKSKMQVKGLGSSNPIESNTTLK